MTELERLQKEINGTKSVFKQEGVPWNGLDCILLCPPDSSYISIKPYGYTHKELESIRGGFLLAIPVTDDRFCFCGVALSACEPKGTNKEALLISIVDKLKDGVFDLDILADEFAPGQPQGMASCPYG